MTVNDDEGESTGVKIPDRFRMGDNRDIPKMPFGYSLWKQDQNNSSGHKFT